MYVVVRRDTGNPKGLRELSISEAMAALRQPQVKGQKKLARPRPIAKKLQSAR
jgi:hypothetical protein